MDASTITRGTVLKCYFPYDEAPHQPGPKPHYCLAVETPFEHRGVVYVVVAYSTSRIDDRLVQAHRGAALFTVPSEFISGDSMPHGLGHYLLDRVAVLPLTSKWFLPFRAKFNFTTEKACGGDSKRLDMYERFVLAQRVLLAATREVLLHFVNTNEVGLAPNTQLR